MIYNYLIRDLYLSYSRFINAIFIDIELIAYIFSTSVIIILFIKLKKNIYKKTIYILTLSIIFYYLIILPFHYGRIINKYLQNGYELVSYIENFNEKYNQYPYCLDSLTGKFIEKENLTEISTGFRYKPYITAKVKNDNNSKDSVIENYSLSLKIPNFNSPRYLYLKHKRKFYYDD